MGQHQSPGSLQFSIQRDLVFSRPSLQRLCDILLQLGNLFAEAGCLSNRWTRADAERARCKVLQILTPETLSFAVRAIRRPGNVVAVGTCFRERIFVVVKLREFLEYNRPGPAVDE